ncbi:MAG: oligosaccharide flippase family protein [Bacteroidetes bacterium]|nr:oligosaccharide flippase family protein [Bacteroidota bacterium]
MQRKFITNLALVLLLNLLIKPFWILGIDRAVQNAVGTEQYGFYASILYFSFLFNIILDFGITNFNNKNISQNNHLLSKHFSSIVMLRILLAGVFAVVTLVGGLVIGYTADMMKMLVAVLFNQVLISFIMYLRSNLAGLHLFKTDSIISVLDRLIMILICGFLLLHFKEPGTFQIQWFIYAQTVAYFITALITLMIVIDKAKVKKFKWRWPFFLMILKKSYPYAVLVLLMTFYNRIDFVMLERMLPFAAGSNQLHTGAYQSGIYAQAYRLLDAANMIAFLFSGLLLPIFARMIKLKHNVEEMVRLSFSLLVIPSIVVAICCYFFSYDLMNLLYKGNNVEESSQVFKILMCCFVPISSTYIFGTLLTANGNLKQLNFMASTGMAINIILNIILIPRYEAYGAAISSISTQLFMAFTQVFMTQKVFRFRKNYKLIFSIAGFIISSVILNSLASSLHLFWISRFVISTLGCFAIAFAFRLISIKNLFRIIREEE